MLYVVANGREIHVYQTNHGPGAKPILRISYNELKTSLGTLGSLLAPESLLRDHPVKEADVGEPIAPGLRSIARITNGSIVLEKNSLNMSAMTGFTIAVVNGSVERNSDGHLEAHLETIVPFQSLQKLNEKLGLHRFKMVSREETSLGNSQEPTVFEGISEGILPKGERVLNLLTWKEEVMPYALSFRTRTCTDGCLAGHVFSGHFRAIIEYQPLPLTVALDGSFRLHLA